MTKLIDLIGQRFGRLLVIGRAENSKLGKARWICECECGGGTIAYSCSLVSGHTLSCGCYQRDAMKKFNSKTKTIHGACVDSQRTRLYIIWSGMKQRCYDENCHSFPDYGGRGIRICNEWRIDFNKFRAWAMANGYSDELSIDRKDNEGNYEPANCRWSTEEEQCNNQRSNRLFTIYGRTQTLSQWVKEYGAEYWLVWQRVNRYNMPLIKALTTPVRGQSFG